MAIKKPNKLNIPKLCLFTGLGVISFYLLVYRPLKIVKFQYAYFDELKSKLLSIDISAITNDNLKERHLKNAKTLIDLKYQGWGGIVGRADQTCDQGLTDYANNFYQKNDGLIFFMSDYVEKLSYAIEESIIESTNISSFCDKLFGVIR